MTGFEGSEGYDVRHAFARRYIQVAIFDGFLRVEKWIGTRWRNFIFLILSSVQKWAAPMLAITWLTQRSAAPRTILIKAYLVIILLLDLVQLPFLVRPTSWHKWGWIWLLSISIDDHSPLRFWRRGFHTFRFNRYWVHPHQRTLSFRFQGWRWLRFI